jgi:hypothetical protein
LLVRSAAGDAACLGTGDIEIATMSILVAETGGLVAAVATAPRAEASPVLEAAS